MLTADAWGTERVHSLWVADFLVSGELLPVEEAIFLVSEGVSTPMSRGVVALHSGAGADSLRRVVGGRLVSWDQVVQRAAESVGEGT